MYCVVTKNLALANIGYAPQAVANIDTGDEAKAEIEKIDHFVVLQSAMRRPIMERCEKHPSDDNDDRSETHDHLIDTSIKPLL